MTQAVRKTVQVLLLTVALAVFWVACVATFHLHEMLLGIPAVVASVVFAFYAISKLPIRFRPTARDLAQIARLPVNVVVDLGLVLWVLALDLTGRRAAGVFRSAAWRANSDDPHDLACRALAVAYTTVSPNCIVVGIDRERKQILFHQLRRAPLGAMTRRLGAGESQ